MGTERQPELIVQARDNERHYVRAYLDFLRCPFLSLEEKVVFLVLKRFLDFRLDTNGSQGVISPSLQVVAKMGGASITTVEKLIASLCEKGVIQKTQRGLNKTNLYVISDRKEAWQANDADQMREYAMETDEERNIRILRQNGYTIADGKITPPRTAGDTGPDEWEGVDVPPGTIGLRLRDPERLYVRVYMDCLDSHKMNIRELGMFILLKSFLNVGLDRGGIDGVVYPSLQTLSEYSGKKNDAVTAAISQLVAKGIIERKKRGLQQSNLYILSDREKMWMAKDAGETRKMARETDQEEALRALEESGYSFVSVPSDKPDTEKVGKAKGTKKPVREPHRAADQRYSREMIAERTEINFLLQSGKLYPSERELVKACLTVIVNTVNSHQKTMQIQKETLPAQDVREVFLGLRSEDILYAVSQYQSVTNKINSPMSYLRSILYQAGTGATVLAEENRVQQELADEFPPNTILDSWNT